MHVGTAGGVGDTGGGGRDAPVRVLDPRCQGASPLPPQPSPADHVFVEAGPSPVLPVPASPLARGGAFAAIAAPRRPHPPSPPVTAPALPEHAAAGTADPLPLSESASRQVRPVPPEKPGWLSASASRACGLRVLLPDGAGGAGGGGGGDAATVSPPRNAPVPPSRPAWLAAGQAPSAASGPLPPAPSGRSAPQPAIRRSSGAPLPPRSAGGAEAPGPTQARVRFSLCEGGETATTVVA